MGSGLSMVPLRLTENEQCVGEKERIDLFPNLRNGYNWAYGVFGRQIQKAYIIFVYAIMAYFVINLKVRGCFGHCINKYSSFVELISFKGYINHISRKQNTINSIKI